MKLFLAQNKKEEIAVLTLVFILTPTSPLVLVLFQFFQDRRYNPLKLSQGFNNNSISLLIKSP